MANEFHEEIDVKELMGDPPFIAQAEVYRLWRATLQKITETLTVLAETESGGDPPPERRLAAFKVVTRLDSLVLGLESCLRQAHSNESQP